MRPVKVILFASFLYTALFSIIASSQGFPVPSVYVVKAQMKSFHGDSSVLVLLQNGRNEHFG